MCEFFEGGDCALEGREFFENRLVGCVEAAGCAVGVGIEGIQGISQFSVNPHVLAYLPNQSIPECSCSLSQALCEQTSSL